MEVSSRVNITLGHQEERLMLSGLHTVEDIFCCCCGQYVGWKYVSFYFISQNVFLGTYELFVSIEYLLKEILAANDIVFS